MKGSNNVIAWSMRNFRITFLLVGCLFVFGIYGLVRIPKQEFPEYTIRQGVVVGIYPGATSEEVEEQLAEPLEQFLMTYKEVKRPKTTSTSQNGMCYVMVELEDDVNDKDEVWSKIKHGLASFKMQLPSGVAALVVNDDFGDTSALLITLESDTRSYRELKGYMDDLSDRLRRIESVSNLRPYGVQSEQISVYVDRERLAAYGIGEKVISAALASQGLTPLGGAVSNAETETPIHIAPSLAGEREVAEQIIWSDPEGHVLRVKDVARVVREYDDPDSYILNNGHRCVLLSMEMRAGFNIVEYGREVDEVLHAFIEEELPADVEVQRIADQAKVVGDSVRGFLRDLFVAMAIIIAVMMLLFPLRSAIVAAITIPLSTFISVGVMYLCGIPLNTVTLAALIVVLGMIVDNSIVVIDGYLDYLGRGYSRWFAAVESAREFFPSLLLATVCICMIFYPILFTMTGMFRDFLTFFPWTITINLMVSLLLSVAGHIAQFVIAVCMTGAERAAVSPGRNLIESRQAVSCIAIRQPGRFVRQCTPLQRKDVSRRIVTDIFFGEGVALHAPGIMVGIGQPAEFVVIESVGMAGLTPMLPADLRNIPGVARRSIDRSGICQPDIEFIAGDPGDPSPDIILGGVGQGDATAGINPFGRLTEPVVLLNGSHVFLPVHRGDGRRQPVAVVIAVLAADRDTAFRIRRIGMRFVGYEYVAQPIVTGRIPADSPLVAAFDHLQGPPLVIVIKYALDTGRRAPVVSPHLLTAEIENPQFFVGLEAFHARVIARRHT